MSTLQSGRTYVSPAKSQKSKKQNHQVKKLIILIIKNKNEKNLTIRKFSKQKKKVQTLPSGRTHRYWFWLKGIARWDLRLAQPHLTTQILVLVKGDRRMGSQVSPTTQLLVLVKGDRRMGSQVSPTTQDLVLVKGDRQRGSQVSPTTQRILALVFGGCFPWRSHRIATW
jgi:hypothetical protein